MAACALTSLGVSLASCGRSGPASPRRSSSATVGTATTPTSTTPTSTTPSSTTTPGGPRAPLPVPTALAPFDLNPYPREGEWAPAGRPVAGARAVYETTLVPPAGSLPAGIAWMDTSLLAARLYSGSKSPGGGPYRYAPPIQPVDASSVVAAFNGGFTMDLAHGGYYTEGRLVDPLVQGAASLVISSDGSVAIGAWGSDVTMTPDVTSVRQNLTLLVYAGQPTALAATPNWLVWGDTCGASSCAASVPSVEHQWRSALGITETGALVYVTGPALDPLQLAQLLVRAGVIRGMELDVNPSWTVLATYDPSPPSGTAAPSNGSKLLPSTMQGPWTFFEPSWNRDFVTMSARTRS